MFMTQLTHNKDYYDETFNKQDFSSTCLERAEFEACEFTRCNFTAARLAYCKFINCTFNHCNLSVIDITGSRFNEVSFTECKLSGTDWTRAYWPDFHPDPELSFSQCILSSASFFSLTLQGLKMDGCKLHDVDFRECDLTGAEILRCDLTGSLFSHTKLQSADFTDSWNFAIDVLNNIVTSAKFSRLEALSLLESLGIELVD